MDLFCCPHSGDTRGGQLRRGLIESCITQLKAQGPSRICNESKEEGHSRRGEHGSRTSIWSQTLRHHPGGNPGVNLKSISHRCHPILVVFVWELTKETIYLPLACLQGGSGAGMASRLGGESVQRGGVPFTLWASGVMVQVLGFRAETLGLRV